MTPSGVRGVLNDAISLYFADATLASAFVTRWCVAAKVETTGGAFHVREDEPAPRSCAGCVGRHETEPSARLLTHKSCLSVGRCQPIAGFRATTDMGGADVNRPCAADDFATIRARMELRREREGMKPSERKRSRTSSCRTVVRSAGRHRRSAPGQGGSANLDECAARLRAGLLISA